MMQFERLIARLRNHFLSLDSGYKEGTWTPSYQGSTTAGTTTYAARSATYIRVGSLVWFGLRIQWSAATGTGSAIITLPFTAAASGVDRIAVAIYSNLVSYSGAGIQGYINAGQSWINLESPTSNGFSTVIAVEPEGLLAISGSYPI